VSENKPARLHLHVVTPRRLLVDAEVDEVRIPGLDGQIGVLPGHGAAEETFEIDGGTAEIVQDRVLVFTSRPE
jgi:F0F1-type ATP synthase epsilon subunit